MRPLRRALLAVRHWGIRRQLTALASVIVMVPLVIGALLLAAVLDWTLTKSLVGATVDESNRLVEIVRHDSVSELTEHEEVAHGMWIQLLDHRGRVVEASPQAGGAPRSSALPAPGETTVEGVLPWWTPPADRDRDIVVATGFLRGDRPYVLLVGTSQAWQLEATWTATVLLLLGIPVLMLGTAVAAWWVTGRALRPVVRIREQVERITLQNLSRRVPTPRSRDEVGRLAVTMNDMLARLEASQQSQARFVADASHELRSPLTTIAGALEIARGADDDRTWRELEPLMTSETERLTKLVRDLLLLTRTDEGGLALQVADVDLDDLASAEVRRLREAGQVQVTPDIVATRVAGDPFALSQVLRNLVDNAARHAHGHVWVRVRPDLTGGALVVVADDGDGIAEADRPRVFERFVRLDDSRSRDLGGSGLGLPIVAQVARAHGGSVEVDESPAGGARFTVKLPARPPQTAVETRQSTGSSA